MENTTKERILEQALVSFARDGYKGTNLRDLAAELGLSKSALYKHYESKEAIWNALLDKMEDYYSRHFGSPEHLPPVPDTWQDFTATVMGMLDFTIHDPQVILTRRILLTEQFRDDRARHFAALHFLTGTREMYTRLFAEMMTRGLLRQDDPATVAFAFTAPITALVHQCDREPGQEAEIMAQIEAFVRHFIRLYGTGETVARGLSPRCPQ